MARSWHRTARNAPTTAHNSLWLPLPLAVLCRCMRGMAVQLKTPFVDDRTRRYITPGASVQPDRPRTDFIVVHHAAAIYQPGTACDRMFAYHAQRWPSYGRIGYHEVIHANPGDVLTCYLVNPPEMQGAGVWGMNDRCYHICAATNFTVDPDAIWIEALAQRCVAALGRYPTARVVGHRDIARPGHGTTCPGATWLHWQQTLHAQIAALLRPRMIGQFVTKGLPIYQRADLDGPLAGHLMTGESVVIDATYPNGAGHVQDGRGFIDLDGVERP